MNRLHLRIYEPPADEPANSSSARTASAGSPAAAETTATAAATTPSLEALELATDRNIIPFESHKQTTIISGRYVEPVERARLLSDNSVCPECDRANIEPLELADGVISPKSRLPIPGTATIVGFHCNECGTEWPVYELTTRRNG